MRMRALRFFTSFVAMATIVLMATAAVAANYTLAGRFTSNRGKNTNVPNVGRAGCGGMTFKQGPGNLGLNGTATPGNFTAIGVNTRGGPDLGCVPAALGVTFSTSGSTTFVLPPAAVKQSAPAAIDPTFYTFAPALPIATIPEVHQIATSNTISVLVSGQRETPMGTMLGSTGTCAGSMTTLMCQNQASWNKFRHGAWTTQTGRAAPTFTWCPPLSPGGAGFPGCANLGVGGFAAIIKYSNPTNGANAFGGTMEYLTRPGPNQGSLANEFAATGALIIPFAPQFANGTVTNPQATGRGYADFHTEYLSPGPGYVMAMFAPVYQGPVLGNRTVITGLTTLAFTLPPGTAFNWGFPLTTGSVFIRQTGSMNTTWTAMGASPMGTALGGKEISLVAGAIGFANLPGLMITSLTPDLVALWLPEPGRAIQLLAGAMGLLGIAIWRSRRNR